MKDERRTLVLLGGGEHAVVVAETGSAAGWTIRGFLDDAEPGPEDAAALPFPRLGALDDLPRALAGLPPCVRVHAAFGDPRLRRAGLDRAARIGPGRACPAIVHPSALVSPSADLAPGSFLGPRVIVNARARIGRGVIVNSGAIIEHDCGLGEFCHIAPGAVLAGSVTVGAEALVGLGAVLLPGSSIGTRATVGAGAVVVSDIPDDARAVGSPARLLAAR